MRAIVGAALAAWCGLGLAPTNAAARVVAAPAATAEATRARAVRALDALPMRFEEAGGGRSGVRFVARGAGYALGFVPGGVDLALGGASAALVRMRFAGASSAAPAGESELSGRTNSVRGTDPSGWRFGVKGYARVRYAGVYPGVDAICYGAGRELEYDFVVAPGADPSAIRLAFAGAESVSVDADGALVVRTAAGEMRQRPAVAYQETARGRTAVACRYALRGGEARLELGAYDRSLPLVVDPVLAYATYVGGSAFDEIRAMTVDPDGNVCLVGDTSSPDFPGLDGTAPTGVDIFVAKISPSGRELVYATTIGSTSYDTGFAVASDADGNLFVAGNVNAPNFPLVRPLQPSGDDAVLFKLDGSGTPLFSTYFGGSRNEGIYALATGPSGDVFAVGDTNSPDFPTKDPLQPRQVSGANQTDAFVSRIRGDGQELLFSTYLGGTSNDTAYAVAADASGAAYVAGITGSAEFPTTAGAFESVSPGCDGSGSCEDAFVVKLDASNAVVYATLLGGQSRDVAFGIAVDAGGSAYVVGNTYSRDFPTKNPIQAERKGFTTDGFVTKLDPDGAGIAYSTYLGGAGFNDSVDHVAVDGAGRAYVVGNNFSTDFPTVDPVQGYVGPDDVPGGVLAVLDPTGSRLLFATFYEGSDSTAMAGVALARGGGGVYVAGTTNASDLVLADPLFAYPGDTEDDSTTGFLARFDGVTGGGVTPPNVTGVRARRKTGKMSKVLVDGANFQPGMRVFVGEDTAPWPSVKEVDSTSVVLRDTADLLRSLPPGARTRVRCVNPDGGEFTAYVTLE